MRVWLSFPSRRHSITSQPYHLVYKSRNYINAFLIFPKKLSFHRLSEDSTGNKYLYVGSLRSFQGRTSQFKQNSEYKSEPLSYIPLDFYEVD